MIPTVVVISGGFDPIHSGHIEYFKKAKELGDVLIVGLNSDGWLSRKKGRPFMPFDNRYDVVSNLKMVDKVVSFNDKDGSAIDAIKVARNLYPDSKIIFANGGDRTKENIPEMSIEDTNVEFVFGVGGENKMNSSSWILEEWKSPKTTRQWGFYRVLYETPNVKVKELTVEPGKSLSMQRHQHRSEHWQVVSGIANVRTKFQMKPGAPDMIIDGSLKTHETIDIPKFKWHQLSNKGTEPVKLIEIQYGERCVEEDIERQE
jgi:cytidyltransferase-like protein